MKLFNQAEKPIVGGGGVGDGERADDDWTGGIRPRASEFVSLLEGVAALWPVQHDGLVGPGDGQFWLQGIRHVRRECKTEGDIGTGGAKIMRSEERRVGKECRS